MIAIKSLLLLKLVTLDVDYDGSNTYLFEGRYKNIPTHIAYTSTDKLDLKEGDSAFIKFSSDCEAVKGVDESFKNYWVSYNAYICSATTMEIQ